MEKNHKWYLGLLTLVLITVALSAARYAQNRRARVESARTAPVPVGAILPLTGSGSFFGEEARNGILLAQEASPDKIKFIFEDSQTDSKIAVNAAQKLIGQDKATALIAWMSGPSSAVAPLAAENKIPLIYGASANDIAATYDYVFKNYIDIGTNCGSLADLLKGKRGALLGINAPSTIGCAEEFKKKSLNLQPYELYQKGLADFRTSLAKVKAARPNFLVLYSLPTEVEAILKQMKELRLENLALVCPHLTGLKCDSETIVKNYAPLLKNALGADFALDVDNPRVKAVSDAYRGRFGRIPTADAIYAYEDAQMLARVTAECGGAESKNLTGCIRDQLATGIFTGVDGTDLYFDSSRVIVQPSSIYKFDGSNWVK